MNKVLVGIIGLVVLAVGASGILALTKNDNKSESSIGTPADVAEDPASQSNAGSGGNSTGPTDLGQTSQGASVAIKEFAFNPATIVVKKGAKVTWTNEDTTKHDITPDTESADFKGSELLAKGETYEFIFNKPGTYTYHCSPHPYMKGTVTVTE